ncbi:MAG: CoA-binding protein [Desulfobulbaceae bacterium]|uniref:CoA-binding protein n=1 Tax=Candidatus Desulfobia pelagia TaxID=2841692 RepID=A0A8J6NCP4_9BACT|nr:CoA-binding protein [Candidatus Desulfobia pelagia]
MDFSSFFRPETVAVIGVSYSSDQHPANVIFSKNLLRYPARIFPVNPKGGELLGQEVFSSISKIPEAIDLAVIAVRADLVPLIISECIKAGVKGAIVISGGFAEVGRHDLQDALIKAASKDNFPVIGPNCLGSFCPGFIDTFFLPSERVVQPPSGNVAIISQSGGILVDLLVKFADEGIGISSAISIGNKALIREIQLLEHFSHDPETDVIAFYIEGFKENEGRHFVKKAALCPKPVVVIKSGKTEQGSRAVSSHTASLAGDYKVFEGVCKQHGIFVAQDEFELVNYCEALSCYSESSGRKIGVVSASGGHGALSVDACTHHGLEVPVLSETLQKELKEVLSENVKSIASIGNPIDLTGSAKEYDFVQTVEILSGSDEIDCILLLILPYVPGISSDLGARVSLIYRKFGKPLVAYVPHVDKYRMLIEGFELNKVPVSSSIEGAVLMAKAIGTKRNA